MPRVVVVDADTLFGRRTRTLLIYLDYAGALRLHWSEDILGELSAALVRTGRKTRPEAMLHKLQLDQSLPAAMVPSEQVRAKLGIAQADVNDRGDAHVAACALAILEGDYYPQLERVTVVTRNVADFRQDALASRGIDVVHPDVLLSGLEPMALMQAFRDMRLDMKGPAEIDRLLDQLDRDGQVATAKILRSAQAAGMKL